MADYKSKVLHFSDLNETVKYFWYARSIVRGTNRMSDFTPHLQFQISSDISTENLHINSTDSTITYSTISSKMPSVTITSKNPKDSCIKKGKL